MIGMNNVDQSQSAFSTEIDLDDEFRMNRELRSERNMYGLPRSVTLTPKLFKPLRASIETIVAVQLLDKESVRTWILRFLREPFINTALVRHARDELNFPSLSVSAPGTTNSTILAIHNIFIRITHTLPIVRKRDSNVLPISLIMVADSRFSQVYSSARSRRYFPTNATRARIILLLGHFLYPLSKCRSHFSLASSFYVLPSLVSCLQ